ncbi:MAG: D-glycero-beta-D-manno-heptose 1-phosphate adenylyltransferase [Saprospiraceae bacterium]|nr:D-glycero-beta-D-manno-heptose 1-phosphate adenylyltransferase [Saprospiraceae bacterium]
MSLSSKVYQSVYSALQLLTLWRTQHQKIVFTNGCFDLLHIGHVLYLEESKSLGDILVVGINSDASVRRLKGPNRPIQDENSRSHVLAGLESVDMVIIFDSDNPLELIQTITPDILVKGGDWRMDQIVGGDFVLSHGGQVRSLRFVDGYSTTAMEQKIKRG